MLDRIVISGTIAVLLATDIVSASHAQTAPNASPQEGAASSSQNAPFAPGFDDMMTMLIQPRHMKLFYAGAEKNWELAAAELRAVRSSFDRMGFVTPTYLGINVNQAVSTMIAPQMETLDAAITSADAKKFMAGFTELTNACNSCHTYMEHPYVVIKVPAGGRNDAFPNQDFKPTP